MTLSGSTVLSAAWATQRGVDRPSKRRSVDTQEAHVLWPERDGKNDVYLLT